MFLKHSCVQAKGAAKDIGKGVNPASSNLPSPGAAADKAAGNAKGLTKDVKQAGKNVASDLSENPLSGLGDKVWLFCSEAACSSTRFVADTSG